MLLDVSLALGSFVLVLALRFRGSLRPETFRSYGVGFLLGMTWELPLFLVGPQFSDDPPYHLTVPFPFHPVAQPVLHSLWDAALFLIGAACVRALCDAPHFVRPRMNELLVLVAWGQAQELCVELLASGFGVWTFLPRAWNPALFAWGQGHVTLVPQLIWLVAPVAFYAVLLHIERPGLGTTHRSPG